MFFLYFLGIFLIIYLGVTNTRVTVKLDVSTPLNEFLKFIKQSSSQTDTNSTGNQNTRGRYLKFRTSNLHSF
jgi:hypothetical protein